MVQLIFFVLTAAIGIQFAVCVYQAQNLQAITVQRPPGVEGFLPIGALMAWKLFLTTGLWDPVHPAAMVILGLALFISFILRKSFCSWICPVGCLSEWLWRLARHILGRNFRMPATLDYILRGLKYVTLGFFVWAVLTMDTRSIIEFLHSPYYKISDVRMLNFFTRMSTLTGAVLLLLAVGSMAVRNFWCRYLCPYGALTGILAFAGLSHIHRRTDTCIGCGRCSMVCPSHLPVDRKDIIFSAECTACLDCVQTCPVQGTLALKTLGRKGGRWTVKSLGIAILLIMVLSTTAARITGYWQSHVSIAEFQNLVLRMDAHRKPHPDPSTN